MFATVINALAIVLGSLAGLLVRKGLEKRYEDIVYASTGIITLVIGIQMALKTTMIIGFSFALILGGLLGTALDIEGAILRLGERLKSGLDRASRTSSSGHPRNEGRSSVSASAAARVDPAVQPGSQAGGSVFATGFLNASVLFCSGAMAILGSFQAGTEGNWTILLTKSILDGFISIMFAGAMGIGVAFSAISVLLYQGLLTLLSVQVKPYVTPLMLSELTGVGGALVMMISLGLLGLKKLKTGDFLPALVVMVLAVLAKPVLTFL